MPPKSVHLLLRSPQRAVREKKLQSNIGPARSRAANARRLANRSTPNSTRLPYTIYDSTSPEAKWSIENDLSFFGPISVLDWHITYFAFAHSSEYRLPCRLSVYRLSTFKINFNSLRGRPSEVRKIVATLDRRWLALSGGAKSRPSDVASDFSESIMEPIILNPVGLCDLRRELDNPTI